MSAWALFIRTFITSVSDILDIQMTVFDKYTFSFKEIIVVSAFIGFATFIVWKFFGE